MKIIAGIILGLTLSLNTYALTMNCSWLKSENHSDAFYRPADFNFQIRETSLKLLKDTFLYRTYTPCWIGGYSSCAFGFTYKNEFDWTIESSTNNILNLSAPSYYWSAELSLVFDKDISMVKPNDVVMMTMTGDDGDGVFIPSEKFTCQAK